MADFPISVPSITNPAANDTLAAVPHHTQHEHANDNLAAIATKLGTGSSTPTNGAVLVGTGTGTSAWHSAREFRVAPGESIQDALDAAVVSGGTVILEAGSHSVSTGLTLDLSGYTTFYDEDTVNIIGSGSGTTEVIFSGGAGVILTITGGIGLNLTIKGIKFRSADQLASGLVINSGSFAQFEDLLFLNCLVGMETTDVLSCRFINCRWRNCTDGLIVNPVNAGSPGNALTFLGCHWGNCEARAVTLDTGVVSAVFVGGSIEGSGYPDAGGTYYGVKSISPFGPLVFEGVYFEGNNGTADIHVQMGTSDATLTVVGCFFQRVNNTYVTTNNIAWFQQDTTGTGTLAVVANGNYFSAAGTYTPGGSYANAVIQPWYGGVRDAESGDWSLSAQGNHYDNADDRPRVALSAGPEAASVFPSEPRTGSKVWRSDLGMEFTYDGTRWSSSQVMVQTVPLSASAYSATTSPAARIALPYPGTLAVHLLSFDCAFCVVGGAALGDSHKWGIAINDEDGNAHGSLSIASGASDAWRVGTVTLANNPLTTSATQLEAALTKTGTPGDLLVTLTMRYRVVSS